MNKKLPPFASAFTPQVPAILNALGITLMLSTYQAGKVIFISALNNEKLIQLPRTFDNAMGLATKKGTIAVACKNEVIVLKNAPGLARKYPPKPNTYDALFVPRATYYTGQLALHDMHYGKNGLLAINTLFSCLASINESFSFTPVWQPPFISELAPEDRCHLNGMAVDDKGEVKYLTALSATNSRQGWRNNKLTGGILMEASSGDIILEGLAMPHSPRLIKDKLYFLESANGELVVADLKSGKKQTVLKIGGFARGMEQHGNYLFIGVSKLRHHTGVFADLPIAETSFAGLIIVDITQNKIAGKLEYLSTVDEIYDVKILDGMKRPGILNYQKNTHQFALVTPKDTFWAIPEQKNNT